MNYYCKSCKSLSDLYKNKWEERPQTIPLRSIENSDGQQLLYRDIADIEDLRLTRKYLTDPDARNKEVSILKSKSIWELNNTERFFVEEDEGYMDETDRHADRNAIYYTGKLAEAIWNANEGDSEYFLTDIPSQKNLDEHNQLSEYKFEEVYYSGWSNIIRFTSTHDEDEVKYYLKENRVYQEVLSSHSKAELVKIVIRYTDIRGRVKVFTTHYFMGKSETDGYNNSGHQAIVNLLRTIMTNKSSMELYHEWNELFNDLECILDRQCKSMLDGSEFNSEVKDVFVHYDAHDMVGFQTQQYLG